MFTSNTGTLVLNICSIYDISTSVLSCQEFLEHLYVFRSLNFCAKKKTAEAVFGKKQILYVGINCNCRFGVFFYISFDFTVVRIILIVIKSLFVIERTGKENIIRAFRADKVGMHLKFTHHCYLTVHGEKLVLYGILRILLLSLSFIIIQCLIIYITSKLRIGTGNHKVLPYHMGKNII